MATKVAVRYVSRRFSSGGKILNEEKAAENIYIKKMEQERLEKLACKGQKAEDTIPSSGGADAKASDFTASTSSTAGVSTDKNINYALVAGVTGLGALGLYVTSKIRDLQEVIELNNNPPGYFCSELDVGLFRTAMRFEVLNNKRSGIFCTEYRFGRGGTTMRWKEIPQGIGPARPNENLTEV